jgi:hypothetical protein
MSAQKIPALVENEDFGPTSRTPWRRVTRKKNAALQVSQQLAARVVDIPFEDGALRAVARIGR